ncbi:glutamate-gated chloride channel isoform X5 [Daktulosphaira vitifoliae]|uniref:glutamate-gated chloride channel isoform X5 n=1 Tax=Daktulosphaira vitifoliae TaxID=58002 RepID=UPI0021AA2238|nr:glutamate-gated chloride channel isoform X5 [Daktulosphaira vitifoliae]
MENSKDKFFILLVILFVHIAQCCCARLDDDGCMYSGNSQHRCPPKPPINYRLKEKEVLDQILGNYDARIRPSGVNGTGDSPCIVFVNILVRSISRIDDYKMEYSVQLTFREQWMDERLMFNDYNGKMRYLTLTETSRVWMPDLFFSNEKEGHFHNIIMPNVYIRIFPNGLVLYSIRISLTLSCPMNLKLYPLDRQTCSLRMVSYGWTTDDLVFLWKEGDPVQVVKNLHLPRFTLEKFLTDYCNSKTNTGEYSCLKVDLLFKREFSYYLIQIYVPCCMLVIVSWVSFWLDQSAVPARVSLGVTTLLTMATQTSGINASLPPVSYTKAIDVWTGVCLTFVFGALLEFALVNYASRSDIHRDDMNKKDLERTVSMDCNDYEDGPNSFNMKPLMRPELMMSRDKMSQIIHQPPPMDQNSCWKSWMSKFPTRSKRIDVISRILFPMVFAMFNMSYWSTYLFREGEDEEK